MCLHVNEILTTQRLEQHYGDCIVELSIKYFRNELPLVIESGSMDSCLHSGDKYLNYTDIIMQRINEEMNHHIISVSCADVTNHIVAQQFDTYETARGLVNIVFLVPQGSHKLQFFWVVRLLLEIVFKIKNIEKLVILFTCFGKNRNSTLEAADIFSMVMNMFHGRNTLIIIPRSFQIDRPSLDILNWIPEDEKDPCFLDIDTVLTLDTWISKEKGFLQNEYLFPQKKIRNAEKCEVNVGVIDTIS